MKKPSKKVIFACLAGAALFAMVMEFAFWMEGRGFPGSGSLSRVLFLGFVCSIPFFFKAKPEGGWRLCFRALRGTVIAVAAANIALLFIEVPLPVKEALFGAPLILVGLAMLALAVGTKSVSLDTPVFGKMIKKDALSFVIFLLVVIALLFLAKLQIYDIINLPGSGSVEIGDLIQPCLPCLYAFVYKGTATKWQRFYTRFSRCMVVAMVAAHVVFMFISLPFSSHELRLVKFCAVLLMFAFIMPVAFWEDKERKRRAAAEPCDYPVPTVYLAAVARAQGNAPCAACQEDPPTQTFDERS